jgi:serine/threonine protein kinase/predicted ATPase
MSGARRLAAVWFADIVGFSTLAWGSFRRSAKETVPAEPSLARERWERVEDLFHAALELPGERRKAFLERATTGTAGLRDEIESLLTAHTNSGMLDRPADDLAALLVAVQAEPAISAGHTVSHYEILEKLGGGGMGVVYKARDLRLERLVALKFLPQHLSADEEAKKRFLMEARAAAALDHPNICAIHESGETADGQLFLAMPCYEGETLKHRISQGRLPVDEALSIAVQVARGLAKAHERGIVHRDIKPANLMLTADGTVKIVDFGIVKLTDVSLTRRGLTPGTVAYMSPEQARGEPVSGRTDLWSLGVVLYEMLTGERPFRGAHEQVVLHAILNSDPPSATAVRPELSPALERVLAKALIKRPDDRYSTAQELILALEDTRAGEAERTPVTLVSAPAALGTIRDAPNGTTSSGDTSTGVLPQGERRQATVLVSNLSGYAGLVETMVPDQVERVIGGIREATNETAARYGGTINQFTGDEIVLLFGIPTTYEDHCVRAVRAAVDLHERVRRLSDDLEQRTGQAVRLHTGIDAGSVLAHPAEGGDRQYRIAGQTVRLAMQLATHAAADEVWITPECKRLVGPFFSLEERKPVALRERDKPLVPHRVVGESGLLTRLEAGEQVGLTVYTGRDQELTTLRHCLDSAAGGEGQFVAIVGEAGIGKSRLLHEFSQGLGGEETQLLRGRCQSNGGSVAYLPFLEALRCGLDIGDDHSSQARAAETAVSRIREIGPELEEFIPLYLHLLSMPPDGFPVPNHLRGDSFRLAMQEALAAILTIIARQRPTVLLLEDWHWVDDASHTVLKQLAEMVSGYRLLILVTCRPRYITDWGNPDHYTQLSLRPLEEVFSVVLMRSMLRAEHFPAELGTLIYERTGGNPFFLEEICHTLQEEGTLAIDDGRVVLAGSLETLDLPDSVQTVIRARMDRLDLQARETLRLASVIGREFTRTLLERTMPDFGRIPQTLETLKSAGLIQQTRVVPEAAYRFKHVLTQEVAYASLLEHQRRELHGRVGEVIEKNPEAPLEEQADRLAYHFSGAAKWRKAVRYGMRSAKRSDALAQFREALAILERAQSWLLKLPEDQERQDTLVEILLQQERLCETLGLRGRQQQTIDQLIGLLEPSGDQAKLAETYVRQGDLNTLLREFAAAEEALEKSLRIRRELGDRVGERNALRSLGLLRWHEGRNSEALEPIERALAIDREREDLEAIVGDLSNLGIVLKGMGEYERARSCLEEALGLIENIPSERFKVSATSELPLKLSYILSNLANICRELGETERGLDYLLRARKQTIEKRLPMQLSYQQTAIAHIYLQEGRIEESLDHYREAVELTRKTGFVPGLSQSLRFLGDLLFGLERYEEALPHLREAARLFAELRDAEVEAAMWRKIATIHERLANDAEGLVGWKKARSLCERAQDDAGKLEALQAIARLTRRCEAEPAQALAPYQEALALAAKIEDRAAEGRLRNSMGIIEWNRGGHEAALGHRTCARYL